MATWEVVRRSQRYDDAFAAVAEVVDAADPIALLAGGAPDDEYHPEIGQLVVMVLRDAPITEEPVNAVWVRMFSEDYDISGSAMLTAMTEDLRHLQIRFNLR